jgi:hypothetical protein
MYLHLVHYKIASVWLILTLHLSSRLKLMQKVNENKLIGEVSESSVPG